MSEKLDRRDFLKAIAAAGAVGLAACRSEPARKLIPYVVPPEEIIPGVSTWYKSTCRECPAGCGLLVRTREARVLKLEGNPDHPVNRGRLCVRGQAAVQGLYNPDRISQPLRRNGRGQLEPISWADAERVLADLLRYLHHQGQAHRVAFVSHRVTGSLDNLFREWWAVYGTERYYQYEPFAYEALRAANRFTFGTSEIPHYDIARARFLLSFGADFLETWVSNVAFTRDFADFRRDPSRRFVAVEPRRSLTAANADEWLRVKPGTEGVLVRGLIRESLAAGLARGLSASDAAALRSLVDSDTPEQVASLTGISAEQVRRLAREFANARPALALGPGVAGCDANATATQVAVNILNYICGNVGETVRFGQGTDYDRVATYKDMLGLVEAMEREEILLALFHHANPLFTLPQAAGFDRGLARVPFKVSFASFLDETTAACDLVLPDPTPLERWEDYQPRTGVYALLQPAMRPVFETKPTPDVLLSVGRQLGPEFERRFPVEDFHAYLRGEWRALHRRPEVSGRPQQDFETFWQQAVEQGGLWAPAPERRVSLNPQALQTASAPPASAAASEELALLVYPSLQLFDGRGANRPWLQEVPEALSKITWNAWVEIHPQTAARLGIEENDLLRLRTPHGALELPAHLYDGVHPDAVAVPLGQGHTVYGRYAEGVGDSPYKLLPPEPQGGSGGRLWSGARVRLEKLAVRRKLVKTQLHDRQEGRGFAQVIPLAELRQGRPPEAPKLPKIYAPHQHKDHSWGMVIDLDSCVGCNACVAACYAENNLPVVGPAQVDRGRHMAWIRLERYYEPAGDAQPEDVRFVPMLCQHCHNAPCESVCPVYATYHNVEGLNVQVYNRCVGTRYCSNNCPYKVRRFNWFDWNWPAPLDLQLNPDVSVRGKGVMEKCTFCVQRIRAAKDLAKDEGRPVRDGEVTPACVQTCPAEALVFGDWNDPESRLHRLTRDNPRRYQILAEHVNTEPAITYLKRVVRREEG